MNRHNDIVPEEQILLHSCCGPCSIAILAAFAERGQTVTSYFYNPNIQPFTEHRARKEAWLQLMEMTDTSYILDDDYPLEMWLGKVADAPGERCGFCYDIRLRAAAETAVANGFRRFTSSLLISPYQKHELIRLTGEKIAAEFGLEFYYEDFRPLFREGQRMAREAGIYMQKYCGCIYSEKERYCRK